MTGLIDTLSEVAAEYEAVVLDQWGVLHDGARPYPGAVAALETLRATGTRLAVLSNSGKRAAPNLARIVGMGFAAESLEIVMSSGEALWRDVAAGLIPERRFLAIARGAGDAEAWADGLGIALVDALGEAEAVLLMGLPDDVDPATFQTVLEDARKRGLTLYCSNPDRMSPRGGGFVMSSGVLAHAHQDAGGLVRFYGKPHRPIFDALASALGTAKLLMVGDSIEHDIAGGAGAGWDTAFIRSGIHAPDFANGQIAQTLAHLAEAHGATPTYSLEHLQ